jgi:hypothetical protein
MTESDNQEISALYIHLYFDEDVSVKIAENLRTRGFDVLTTVEAGMLGRDDDEQLLYAVSQRRAILTHNRLHFEEQHAGFLESGLRHYGIIIAKRRKPEELLKRLLLVLDSMSAEDMENQMRYL